MLKWRMPIPTHGNIIFLKVDENFIINYFVFKNRTVNGLFMTWVQSIGLWTILQVT